MPSGPKRRKSGKKKRTPGHRRNPSSSSQNININNNNNNPPGIGNVKTEDSDGDADEFSTPAFDANNSPFDDLDKKPSSSAAADAPEEASQIIGFETEAEAETEAEGEAEAEGEVSELEYQGDNTHDRDVTCSNSSFSDAEVRENEIKGKDEASNSASLASSFGDLVTKEVSKLREKPVVGEVSNSATGNAVDSDAVKPIISVDDGVVCAKKCVSNESEDGLNGASHTKLKSKSKKGEAVASSRGPNDVAGNGAEYTKNYESPHYSDNEPLLQVAPRQTTSWKSCCGLFELCTGSDR